jgi:hypothetical protein
MTFATAKLNQSSKKGFLVRIEPARYVNDDLSAGGGGDYTVTLSGFVVSRVLESGTELTEVSGSPANGEYSFNETTGVLTIDPTNAPSGTNPIVVYHYLFFTNEIYRRWYEDPDDTGTAIREWQPRLQGDIATDQSVKNVLAGVFSLRQINISVINADSYIQPYLGSDDSFYKKSCKVWMFIDEISNKQKIYEGIINNISFTKNMFRMNVEDIFSVLDKPAYMGDTYTDVYMTKDQWPSMLADDEGLPIPFMLCNVSRYKTITDTYGFKVDGASLYRAYISAFNATISTTNNREWVTCRSPDQNAPSTAKFVTALVIDNTNPNYTVVDVSTADIAHLQITDNILVRESSIDYYHRIIDIDRYPLSGNPSFTITKQAGITTAASFERPVISTVVVDDGTAQYICLYNRDYTVSAFFTSGSNTYYRIIFTNNFEANHAGLTALDPSLHTVTYKASPSDIKTSEFPSLAGRKVIQKMLNIIGITTKDSTFQDISTEQCAFSIPKYNEFDYGNYYSYIADILKSLFGFVFLSKNFEAEFGSFGVAPGSTTELNDDNVLEDTFNCKIEYKDIVNTITFKNEHYIAENLATASALNPSPNPTKTQDKSKYLHDYDKATVYEHVLENMSTSNLGENISKILRNRKAIYSVTTKTFNLDTEIGDSFKLVNDWLLGGSADVSAKTLRTRQGMDNSLLEMSDLINT